MNTTDIFVEQVLIGLLTLLIPGLLFWAEVEKVAKSVKDFEFFWSVIVLGAAYLIGIVYDRYADTLLEDIEQHNRIQVALKEDEKYPGKEDPFPEDKYRVEILRDEGASRYASYLRTRIRLTRALATLSPGLSVALLFMLIKSESWTWHWAVVPIGLIYGLAFVAQLLRSVKVKPTQDGKAVTSLWYKVPRTDDMAGRAQYKEQTKYHGFWWSAVREPAALGALLLTAVACVFAYWASGPLLVLIPIIGFGLTLLIGLVWWRIQTTFSQFLIKYVESKPGR